MATTDPLTGATVQDQSDAATGGTQIGNVVKNLRSFLVTRFSTTGARDTAYTSFTSGGGTMADGMLTTVAGTLYRRISGTWRVDRNRIIQRTVTIGGGGTIASGGASETGITAGYTALSSFTLYEAGTVSVMAHFRINTSSFAAGAQVKIDGTQVGYAGLVRGGDYTTFVIGTVALTAGSHTISARVDAVGGTVTWVEGRIVVHEGIAE